MTRPHLRLVRPGDVEPEAQPALIERRHDRPVAWDGKPITWRPWEPDLDVRICPPAKTSWCPCGRPGPQWICTGLIDGWVSLYLLRCWCGRDVAIEARPRGDAWVLDESDYSDEGSWPR